MSRLLAALLGLGLGALPAAPAGAVACTPDPVPAATLLLPYFDLDTRDLAKPKPKREATRLWIMNVDAVAIIARVTLWTDLSVPTLAFDIYLTGYDVEEVDLWQVFRGTLPGNIAIPCNNGAPPPTPELSPEQVAALRLAHAGKPDPANEGLCSAVDHGDTLLRGYVTVDNIVGCNISGAVYPSDPGYFGAGGIASNGNVLAGQYLVQSRKLKAAESGRLVAIEAAPGTFGPGEATFYGRYVGYSGEDAREPLPSTWGVRYLNDLVAKESTELVVWRSSEAVQGPFVCEALGEAGWYPEGQAQLLSFDDFENPFQPTEPAFPAEANRVAVGGAALPIAEPRGWIQMGLDREPGGGAAGRQSHVTARVRQGALSARGLVEAVALAEPCVAAPAPAEPIPATAPKVP